jgi:hypothetical protein
LGEPAPIWQVAAGEQVLVTFMNDADELYVCTLPGAPKVELNPRPGTEQSARFALADAGRYTLSCSPMEQTAAAGGGAGTGDAMGESAAPESAAPESAAPESGLPGDEMGGSAMEAAVFDVR